MKSDRTPLSTSKTASERAFSSRPTPTGAAATKATTPKSAKIKQPPKASTPNKKKKDASQKSLIEDKTDKSDSTAHGRSLATATTQQSPAAETAFLAVRPAAPAASAENSQIQFPVGSTFDETRVSPASNDALRTRRRSSFSDSNDLNMHKYVHHPKENQPKHETWIRKLGKQKWIPFVDIVMTGFTLLFYTIAFYLAFNINTSLDMKLTPEFRTTVYSSTFKNCNHSSWADSDNFIPSTSDVSRCYDRFENGRVIYEIFKSSTTDPENGCNIDLVEVYPCYSSNNSMNIFFGVNDTEFVYFCNASSYYQENNALFRNTGVFSFHPPVKKHAMLNNITMPYFLNRIVSSTAFFFQCPKCSLAEHLPERDSHGDKLYYRYSVAASSIPKDAQHCATRISTGRKCNMDKSRFIKIIQKSFSRLVVPFKIVEDDEFCDESHERFSRKHNRH